MKDGLRRHRRRLAAKESVGAAGEPGNLHHQAALAAGLPSRRRTVRVLAGGVRREIGGGHGRAQRDPEAPLTRAARYT